MKLNNVKSAIYEIINGRFDLKNNESFESELLSLADNDLKSKDVLRIKRVGVKTDNWKTLMLIEIEALDENDIKIELKKAIRWVASVKESLLGSENTDLYLFLTFNGEVSIEECLRIESTEQFCRKYVLFPDEEIPDFLNRTFLQKIIDPTDTAEGEDPLVKAFAKTSEKYIWLTPELRDKWKKIFLSDLTGNELADALLNDEELS